MSLHPIHGLGLATATGLVALGAAGWAGAVPAGLALSGCAAAIGGLAGLVGLGSARPDLRWFGPCVTHGGLDGALALSFDDGPHPRSTPALLDALAASGAQATFFVLADRVAAHPDLLRAMVAAGHEIGLHGLSHHPWLTVRAPADGAAELRRAAQILTEAGAPPPRWFRPPFGVVSPRVYAAAACAGLEIAWCSVRTRDGGPIDDATLLARCRAADAHDVVLLHEGDRPALRLLPAILSDWRARGLSVQSLGACQPVRA